MARYRITHVAYSESTEGHQHVSSIGIGKNAESVGVKWSVGAVRGALEMGHRFYAVSASGAEVDVEPLDCLCGVETIRLHDDANLDPVSLPRCSWAAKATKTASQPG